MQSLAQQYLERIKFEGQPIPDVATASRLQLLHLEHVPFENLDVFHRRGVTVDQATSVQKLLGGRGGWCFELNGSFGWLLGQLGFVVDLVACTVLLGDTAVAGPDHLALILHIEDRRFLVDVGFGDSFTQPLDLDAEEAVSDLNGEYRFVRNGMVALEHRRGKDADWEALYRIDSTPRRIEDFNERSSFLQTEPGLKWTTAPFATRLLRNGRITLLSDRLKMATPMGMTEFPVTPEEWPVLLGQWFSIVDVLERD